jgi:endonuclease G
MIILPEGTDDLSRIDNSTRAIAVCMRNKQGIRSRTWQSFVTTIRNVESVTHFNFLSELPVSVQNAIETHRDSAGTAATNPCQ